MPSTLTSEDARAMASAKWTLGKLLHVIVQREPNPDDFSAQLVSTVRPCPRFRGRDRHPLGPIGWRGSLAA